MSRELCFVNFYDLLSYSLFMLLSMIILLNFFHQKYTLLVKPMLVVFYVQQFYYSSHLHVELAFKVNNSSFFRVCKVLEISISMLDGLSLAKQ